MKKFLIMLVMSVMTISASAFEFDGINLNANFSIISRQISARGYVYDATKKALVGKCQGTQIFLSLNGEDVNTKGKLGQLVVDVPVAEKKAMGDIYNIFNVLYHPIDKQGDTVTYSVDEDGTTLDVTTTSLGIRLTYSTPYYNK